MKNYSKAPDECHDRVEHLVRLFHEDLSNAGVTFDVLSVVDNEGESCLTHQGYPAAAVVRIVGPKERTKGAADAEIVIDEPRYMRMSDPERDALLDHEIYHVTVQHNPKNDKVNLDENGRPKLRLRKHDIQVGWFSEIAMRHGAASMERKQALDIYLGGQQTFFNFEASEQLKMIEASDASEKVKEVASKIVTASPAVKAAARHFVDKMQAMARKDGTTVSVHVVGEPNKIVIDANGPHSEPVEQHPDPDSTNQP